MMINVTSRSSISSSDEFLVKSRLKTYFAKHLLRVEAHDCCCPPASPKSLHSNTYTCVL